jgi:DNA-binding MarR family transcriptional regulator
MADEHVRRIQAFYPQVWHTCHRRHPPAAAKAGGLREREAMVLAHLSEDHFQTPPVLCRHLGINASTLSELLDGLEERGLVRRERREDDRRRQQITLTDEGRAALERGSALDPERVAAALGQLSEEERRRAVEGLGLLARACRALRDAESHE